MKNLVGIINYNAGNISKLENVLKNIGIKTKIIRDPKCLRLCDKIILPGVGNYGVASKFLKKKKIDIEIKKFIAEDKPILAICLGFQLMFSRSDESTESAGINFFSGKVRSLKKILTKSKIPNIGWRKVYFSKNSNSIFKNLSGEEFYFAHSYYCDYYPNLPSSYFRIENKKFLSSINSKNIFCYQFHPEMSGDKGVEILKAFGEI